jgi:hypothetical protein
MSNTKKVSTKQGRKPIPADIRFDALVTKSTEMNGCWIFGDPNGASKYAKFFPDQQNSILAHHFAWERANGRKVPRNRVLAHKCDQPRCTRPSHLFVCTQKENIADMFRKGRDKKYADRKKPVRLTPTQKADILKRIEEGASINSVATAYGRTCSHISGLVQTARKKPVMQMMKLVKSKIDSGLLSIPSLLHIPDMPSIDPWDTFEPCKAEWQSFAHEYQRFGIGKVA